MLNAAAITLALLALTAAEADWRQQHRTFTVADGIITFVADESPGGMVQGMSP